MGDGEALDDRRRPPALPRGRLFRNFSRAGRCGEEVGDLDRGCRRRRRPGAPAPFTPASTRMDDPVAASAVRVVIASRATAPMEGSASPRKPRVAMANRSPSGQLRGGVALDREFEILGRSCRAPSSTTRISRRPPASTVTSMVPAPASMAFSTSSLTAAAGRSTTSPAAMRSTRMGSRRRTWLMVSSIGGDRPDASNRARIRPMWGGAGAGQRGAPIGPRFSDPGCRVECAQGSYRASARYCLARILPSSTAG